MVKNKIREISQGNKIHFGNLIKFETRSYLFETYPQLLLLFIWVVINAWMETPMFPLCLFTQEIIMVWIETCPLPLCPFIQEIMIVWMEIYHCSYFCLSKCSWLFDLKHTHHPYSYWPVWSPFIIAKQWFFKVQWLSLGGCTFVCE